MCNHLLRFVEGKAGPIGFNGSAHHSIEKDLLDQFFITCRERQAWEDGSGRAPNWGTRSTQQLILQYLQAAFSHSVLLYILTSHQLKIWNSLTPDLSNPAAPWVFGWDNSKWRVLGTSHFCVLLSLFLPPSSSSCHRPQANPGVWRPETSSPWRVYSFHPISVPCQSLSLKNLSHPPFILEGEISPYAKGLLAEFRGRGEGIRGLSQRHPRALQSPHNRGNSLSPKAGESQVGWGKNKVELGARSG